MAENLADDDRYWRELLIELNEEDLKDYPQEKIQHYIETGEGGDEIMVHLKKKEIEKYNKRAE